MEIKGPTTTAGHPFDDVDADIILRTCDNTDFHVHQTIISLASPIFKDMITLGRSHPSENPSRPSSEKPVVPIAEDSIVIDQLLRFCYPVADPIVPFEGLCGIMEAARKYDIGFIELAMKKALHDSQASRPLQVYAVAARFGFEDLAAGAAKCWKEIKKFSDQGFYLTESFDETREGMTYVPEMDHISAGAYFRLTQFLYQSSTEGATTQFLMTSTPQRSNEQTNPLPVPSYCNKQADIIIRSRDGIESHVNSLVLSLAAPGLAPAISESLNDQKDRGSDGLCIVHLPEHHDAISPLLRLSHFQLLPVDMSLNQVISLLQIASKYDAISALEEGKRRLRSHISKEPFQSYLWAAQLGLEEEARAAAVQCARMGWGCIPELENFDASLYRAFLVFQHAYGGAVCNATSSKSWATRHWRGNRSLFADGDLFGTCGPEITFALMVDVEQNSRGWEWYQSNLRTLASEVDKACSKVSLELPKRSGARASDEAT